MIACFLSVRIAGYFSMHLKNKQKKKNMRLHFYQVDS